MKPEKRLMAGLATMAKRKRQRPEPVFLVYGMDYLKFAKRHGIQPFTGECDQCGAPTTTSIPFRSRSTVGLQAPACECGNTNTPFCVIIPNGSKSILAPKLPT